jgi:hypothetical protein
MKKKNSVLGRFLIAFLESPINLQTSSLVPEFREITYPGHEELRVVGIL